MKHCNWGHNGQKCVAVFVFIEMGEVEDDKGVVAMNVATRGASINSLHSTKGVTEAYQTYSIGCQTPVAAILFMKN